MSAGAKSKYEENFPLLAEQYARNGLNDEQIAKKLGISLASFYNYQNAHLEFLEAIKRGKKPVDVEVENALLKRALGYEAEDKTTEVEIDAQGNPKLTKIKTFIKHIPADIGAIAFWLKNRNPEKWRELNRTDITTNGKDINNTIDYSKLSETALKEIINAGTANTEQE